MAKINARPTQFAGSFFIDQALPRPRIKKPAEAGPSRRSHNCAQPEAPKRCATLKRLKARKPYRRSTGAGLAAKRLREVQQRRVGQAWLREVARRRAQR